jgi:hypothetical protein
MSRTSRERTAHVHVRRPDSEADRSFSFACASKQIEVTPSNWFVSNIDT